VKKRSTDIFSTVRSEGPMLPPEILARIVELDPQMGGLTPEAYHLDKKVNEAINKSWNRLVGVWETFRKAKEVLPEGDPGTTLTREKWLLKLFDELGYGRLQLAKPIDVEGTTYAISHIWKNTPIHLIGFRAELDRTVSRHGGATYQYKPHSMVQTFLNRTEGHLWAFLSNGLRFRILRDNTSLVRQAYVEFDLEAMMDGGVFPDFKLLWLLCHQSRVEADRPENCWLEKWSRATQEIGTRVREDLRVGVQRAIEVLGAGFFAHPENNQIREDLRSGRLDKQAYYRELLRFVYQLIFLFVAEDRDLLAPPSTTPEAKDRYARFYSTTRLRFLAGRKVGTRHDDLYRVTRLVINSLGEGEGRVDLGIPGLNSSLFSVSATPSLKEALIANADYLEAVRALAIVTDKHGRRPTNFQSLGAEELGSVYESLLEMHPDLNIEAKTFALKVAAGNERKTTGSYYTPASLISCLLDSALDPVLEAAAGKENPEKAILDLKVCDPACGSGHFLIAAAKRMAGRLATIRAGGDEPSTDMYHRAVRDVIGHCIYGVDINPMSVELCKVSLWMEALEPGKPLSFLDHRIVCGNSLLGTTPALMAQGVPDEAFQPLEGDERASVTSLKKQNRAERAGQETLRFGIAVSDTTSRLGDAVRELDQIDDSNIEGIRVKEKRYRVLLESDDLRQALNTANAWCAAFIAPRTPSAPRWTHDAFRRVSEVGLSSLPAGYRESLQRLADGFRFFHWHVAFPDVFRAPEAGISTGPHGWRCGFDVVLGNPPWERIKLQEQEFFAERRPDIANAPNAAARRRMIRDLATEDPALYGEYLDALRKAEGESHLVRNAGFYPLCGRGDVNTYALFAELFLNLLSAKGRAGIIVPTGIATDDSTKVFFDALVSGERLASLYDYENREGLFPAVDSRQRFCALTLSSGIDSVDFVFFATNTGHLGDDRRHFSLSSVDIARVNPNTKTCPIFRSKIDAELARKIYAQVPVLIDEARGDAGNPWRIQFSRMFDMANDSGLFHSSARFLEMGARADDNKWIDHEARRWIPLYEAKMANFFDHRATSYETRGDTRGYRVLPPTSEADHRNPGYVVMPFYWVPQDEVDRRLHEKGWTFDWLIGWRDITSATNERTTIPGLLPRVGTGDTFLLMLPGSDDTRKIAALFGNLNALIFDHVARMKVGGVHMKYHVMKQIAALSPDAYDETSLNFIATRVLELVYTASDLRSFGGDLGYTGDPFPWDPARRAVLRAELDAYYAKLYGLTRDELRYVLDPADVLGEDFPSETFRVLKNNEIREFGEYRTRRLVLEAWDRLIA